MTAVTPVHPITPPAMNGWHKALARYRAIQLAKKAPPAPIIPFHQLMQELIERVKRQQAQTASYEQQNERSQR